jgi:hypothetical protein
MATPHVSGVAALVYARIPQLSPQDVKLQLMQTVKPLPGLSSYMVSPGIVNAEAAIGDPSNYPPDLAPIPSALITPTTRVKTIPLLAVDRENDNLSFTASIVLPQHQTNAAAVDSQYRFNAYQPQFDNYYHLGEKRLTTDLNKTFLILSDGAIYELIFPYYYYRASVDSLYFQDPNLLVNASSYNGSAIATLSLTSGTPEELRIETAKGFQGSFSVSVAVSDGNRKDIENFGVTVQKAENCQ